MVKRRKIKEILSNDVLYASVGCGTGVVTLGTLKYFIDPTFGKIPFLDQILPENFTWFSSGGAIILGGITTGLGFYLKKYSALLVPYGITTLVGGLINGVLAPPIVGLRTRVPTRRLPTRAPLRRAPRATPTQVTSPYYPKTKILA